MKRSKIQLDNNTFITNHTLSIYKNKYNLSFDEIINILKSTNFVGLINLIIIPKKKKWILLLKNH